MTRSLGVLTSCTSRISPIRTWPPPPSSPNIHQDGARTTLFVALRGDDALLGVFIVFRKEVRPFSDKQIALVKNFAAQAVIAMENARLIDEQREALEQQTATAEVLQVINASPGDLGPVFDAMLEKALRLCDAAFGNLWTYDGEVGRLAAICGASPEYRAELMRGGPQKPEPGGSLIRLVEGEPLVHIPDITAEGAHRSGAAVRRMLADRAGARTVLWVPMRKEGALLGFFTIYRTEVRPFTNKQIALLENFAVQAMIAMENARLITEQREALEQQTATAEVLQVINASPGNLAPVFDAMLNKAVDLCGAAFGLLLTYDGERFHHAAFRSIPPAYVEFMREHQPIYAPESMPGRLALGERLVHVLDITDTDAYRSGDANRRAIADLAGARTIVAVPLRKDSAFVGAIVVFRQEVRAFSDKQIALLENFAAQGVIAIENARLLTEQREALEQQTATAEVLQVINANPGTWRQCLTPCSEGQCECVKRPLVFYGAMTERYLHVTAVRGVPAAYEQFLKRGPHRPSDFQQRLLHTKPFEQIADLTLTEAYRTGQPLASMGADLGENL